MKTAYELFNETFSGRESFSISMYAPFAKPDETEKHFVSGGQVFEQVEVPRQIALGFFQRGYDAALKELSKESK